ncbi:hypothetical protein Vadar_033749 [Vaccinium darrowii]|uniref:Uncharacterized protein n=1 Tax=Vaccinium darrowii TaxID=229202 RepID=A0ACB7X6G9_9ERIC|nr:hypothetical protein Vadar_033749 [Vaccinium darrowii]
MVAETNEDSRDYQQHARSRREERQIHLALQNSSHAPQKLPREADNNTDNCPAFAEIRDRVLRDAFTGRGSHYKGTKCSTNQFVPLPASTLRLSHKISIVIWVMVIEDSSPPKGPLQLRWTIFGWTVVIPD